MLVGISSNDEESVASDSGCETDDEPEAAAEPQLLEGLYAGVLPWPVLRDWPGFYRALEPLGYWCYRSWQGAWGWKDDHHHRRWTPAAAAALVSLGNAALDASEAGGRGA